MSVVSPIFPTLSLATIAASIRQRGHHVEILDLSYMVYDHEFVRRQIITSSPDVVGITALTPMMNQLTDMSLLIKDISQNIVVV